MIHLVPEVQQLIEMALAEDQVANDPTTDSLVPHDLQARGVIRAKAEGVLAGVDVALSVFKRVDQQLDTTAWLADGASVSLGNNLAFVDGQAASILRAERTAINFLQRMSGIATEAARYVKLAEGTRARIVDTRKTVPGFRLLDKYSVRMGGAGNHRMNLADGILVKDNHLEAMRHQGFGIDGIVRKALDQAPHNLKVEIEVEDLTELQEALDAGAHIILLDNMPPEEMRQAVGIVAGRAVLEASGGVNLDTVRVVAETGVDLISVGSLTHSVKALDISLDLEFA